MKYFIFLSILAGTAALANAQTFDVASVRVNTSASEKGEVQESIVATPGSLIMKALTLRACVRWAYGVRDFQITGGPGWLSTERYDISAKTATKAGDAGLRKMLQALLADRFQLRLREEPKQLPVYALVVARRKPALRPAADTEVATMRPGDGALEFRNTSMEDLAQRLASRPLSVDRPVIDKTGLRGGYDFSLKFADNADGLKGALEEVDRGVGQSIFSVIQGQLGLKLAPQKASLRALVIEHAVESPGDN